MDYLKHELHVIPQTDDYYYNTMPDAGTPLAAELREHEETTSGKMF